MTSSGMWLGTVVQPAAGFPLPSSPYKVLQPLGTWANLHSKFPDNTPGLSRGLRDMGLGGCHEPGKPSPKVCLQISLEARVRGR